MQSNSLPSEQKHKGQSQMIGLDLMRGIAALTVLVAHLRGNSFVEYGALPVGQHTMLAALFFFVTRVAYEAVIVFFVLSGFLVGGQVLTRLRDGRFGEYDYIVDRTTRILIPLIPACLFTAAVDIFFYRQPPPIGQLIANMVGLNEIVADSLTNNGVLWSLTYEIWFYILAGTLAYVASRRLNSIAGLVLAVCCLVFVVLQTRYLVFWMFGAFVSTRRDIRFKGLLAVIGVCMALIGTVFYELAADSRSMVSVAYLPPIVAEALMCVGVGGMLPFLASKPVNSLLWRLRGLAAALAGFSYTLYLTHRPTDAAFGLLFEKADTLSLHSLAVYGIRIVVCILVAVAFYFAFERNTATVRGWLRKRSASRVRTEQRDAVAGAPRERSP
jgi:peptidoglycan/LPS O-acetylase OafA/YrhL